MRRDGFSKVILGLILLNLLGLDGFIAWRFLSAQKPAAGVIQANGFELVDDKGKAWAELGFDKNGTAGFSLFDYHGKVRANIHSTRLQRGGSAGIAFFDDLGLPLMTLSQSSLNLSGKEIHASVHLAVYDNSPQISLYDKNYRKRISVSLQKDGTPGVYLRDAKDKLQAELTVPEKAGP